MTRRVAQTTDTNQPVDLDDELTEFEVYARDYLPKVSPKSPYYKLEERAFDSSTYTSFEDLRNKLHPQVQVPVWHSEDVAAKWRNRTPVLNAFYSEEHSVVLTREEGMRDEHGITCASWRARLKQYVNNREPMIESWLLCLVNTAEEGTTMGHAAGAHVRMTLDEAAEVAHLLLLLVDVARDTAAEQA